MSSTTLPPSSVQCCSASVGSVAPLAPWPARLSGRRPARGRSWSGGRAWRRPPVAGGRDRTGEVILREGSGTRRVGWHSAQRGPVDLSTRSVTSGVLACPAASTPRTGERQPARVPAASVGTPSSRSEIAALCRRPSRACDGAPPRHYALPSPAACRPGRLPPGPWGRHRGGRCAGGSGLAAGSAAGERAPGAPPSHRVPLLDGCLRGRADPRRPGDAGVGGPLGALFGLFLRELLPGASRAAVDEASTTGAGRRAPARRPWARHARAARPSPYRKFNDVLDGATFGAVSGSMFVGAQVVAQSIDLLTAGARPGGDTWSWVLRVLEHAVAVPLVAAGPRPASAGRCGCDIGRRCAIGPARAPDGLGRGLVARVLVLRLHQRRSRASPGRAPVRGARARDDPWAHGLWLRTAHRPRASPGGGRGRHERATGLPGLPPARPRRIVLRRVRGRAARAAQACRPERHRAMPSRPRSLAFVPSSSSSSAWAVVLAGAGTLVQLLAPVARPPCPDPTQPCPAGWRMAASPAGHVSGRPTTRSCASGRPTPPRACAWQLDFDPRWWLLDTSDTWCRFGSPRPT